MNPRDCRVSHGDTPGRSRGRKALKERDKIGDAHELVRQIRALRDRLAALDGERLELTNRLDALERAHKDYKSDGRANPAGTVTMASPAAEKVALFRSLFRGREEVFPRRWENSKTGKAGYAPACRNEWVRGVCGKPRVRCGECPNQAFVPFGDDTVRSHLTGKSSGTSADFTAGVYPMMADETCLVSGRGFRQEVLDAGCRRVPRHRTREGYSCRDRTLAFGQWRACMDLFREPVQRPMRVALGRFSSRQRWIAARILDSIHMIGYFRVRIRCPRAASAI